MLENSVKNLSDVIQAKGFLGLRDQDKYRIFSRVLNMKNDNFMIETNYSEFKDAVKRDLTSSPAPEHVVFWVDDFSNNTILTGEKGLGANLFTGLDYNQSIPFSKNTPVDEIDGEDSAADASVTFTKQSHEPIRFSAFINISKMLNIQTDYAMEAYLQKNISKAIAAKVEAKLLAALVADTEINIIPDGLTHAKLNSMEAAVNQINDVQLRPGYVCHPDDKGLLKTMVDTNSVALLWRDGKLNDERILSSKNMASGSLLYGDWSQAFILQFDKIQVIRDLFTQAKAGFDVLVVNGWYSYSYSDPKSFSLIADITA